MPPSFFFRHKHRQEQTSAFKKQASARSEIPHQKKHRSIESNPIDPEL